jgi:hypothetical protein
MNWDEIKSSYKAADACQAELSPHVIKGRRPAGVVVEFVSTQSVVFNLKIRPDSLEVERAKPVSASHTRIIAFSDIQMSENLLQQQIWQIVPIRNHFILIYDATFIIVIINLDVTSFKK